MYQEKGRHLFAYPFLFFPGRADQVFIITPVAVPAFGWGKFPITDACRYVYDFFFGLPDLI
jgi:hypothetical protein